MRLTLRKLQLFCAIARTGSTMAGAEAASLSQSATSAALGELETALGARLFDRVGKRLVLNDAGRSLLPEALALLEQAQVIDERFGGGAAMARVRFRLAASTTIGNYVLPSLLAAFREQMPQASLDVWIGNTLGVAQIVAGFEADLGMIEGPCHIPDLQVLPWLDDELVLVAAPGHALAMAAEQAPLSALQLRAAPWLLREAGSGTREAVEQALLPYLHHVQSDTTLGSSEAIKNAVAAGLGVSCLSRVLVQDMIDAGRLHELKSELPVLKRSFSLIHRREKRLSDALTGFLELCRSAAAISSEGRLRAS